MTLTSKLRYLLLSLIAAMVLGVGGAHAGALNSDADSSAVQGAQGEVIEWTDHDDDDLDDEWGDPDDEDDYDW
ncbi:hypothetical protein [Alkalilimnicola ehrlichii]|uniref:hypothetical protein n=1 Tax=Alkalilimnicola ehrlichii TaxID=351052 RepID=UPI003B9F33F9